MKQFAPEHVELLAQTLCAAYWRDMPPASHNTAWDAMPTPTKGNWRRAAQAAMRTLAGNAHWLFTHCPEGHEFSDADESGVQFCVHCGAEHTDR